MRSSRTSVPRYVKIMLGMCNKIPQYAGSPRRSGAADEAGMPVSVVLISVSTMSSGLVKCVILAVVEEQELLVTSARMDCVRTVAKSIIR